MSKFKEQIGTNVVTTTAGALNVYEAYAAGVNGNSIEGTMLKFSRFGDYRAGKDGAKIELGTRFTAVMQSVQVGWLKWIDGKPVERVMGHLHDGFKPPKRDELDAQDESMWPAGSDGRPRDPWQFCNTILLIAENGEQFTFATGSRGGIQAIGNLCAAYGRRMRSHPGEMPTIALDSSSYPHRDKQIGHVPIPVFRITGWADADASAGDVAKQDDEISDSIPF
jgi:hypothetical protein